MHSKNLFSEEMLFAQGIRAGEFAFTAQDAAPRRTERHQQIKPFDRREPRFRRKHGTDLESVVSVMVYLPEYFDAAQVASTGGVFGKNPRAIQPRLSV
jgi:hypothetical protein